MLAVAALFAAACGSIVSPATQEQLSQAGGQTFDLGGEASDVLPPGAHVNDKGQIVNAKGEVIGTVDGAATGTAAGGPASAGATGQAAGGSVASSGYTEGGNEFGPGVTEKHILVGYAVNNNARAGCEAGGTCDVIADTRGMEEDFAEWFNKHGGIAGRKIKLVKFEFSSTEATTSEQLSQRICTYFTQDHPVFAGIGTGDENFNRCLNRGGVTLVGGQRTGLDANSFNSNPYVYLTGGLHLTNAGIVQGKGLLESGYFDKPAPAKVGLLTYDHPTHLRAANELKRTLATGGVEIAAQENIYFANSTAEFLSRSEAEIQNAVLRFKTEGITHAMFLTADGGGLPLLFLRHAQDQNYFPRYGFNTSGGAATMVDGGGGIGVEQRNFVDSVEVGWFPASDISEGQKYQRPPNWPLCQKIADKYGRPTTTTNERIVIANYCDFFQFLKDGVEAGLPNITPDSFQAGVESLGRSWSGAGAHSTFFGPTSHDGAGAYQVNRYYESCECIKPSGPIKRFK